MHAVEPEGRWDGLALIGRPRRHEEGVDEELVHVIIEMI
jgi:hypothetical protein